MSQLKVLSKEIRLMKINKEDYIRLQIFQELKIVKLIV